MHAWRDALRLLVVPPIRSALWFLFIVRSAHAHTPLTTPRNISQGSEEFALYRSRVDEALAALRRAAHWTTTDADAAKSAAGRKARGEVGVNPVKEEQELRMRWGGGQNFFYYTYVCGGSLHRSHA